MSYYIRAFLVLFFFGLLTACGGGGGNTAGTNPIMPPSTTMTMMPPMTMTTAPPVTLGLNSPEIGALHYAGQLRSWLVVVSVTEQAEERTILNQNITLRRLSVARYNYTGNGNLPEFNRVSLHATGDLVPLVTNGVTVTVALGQVAVAFETIPGINGFAQLCPASWLGDYIRANLNSVICPSMSGLSYTPNMPNVLHAAMADTFHRGIAIGESNFAFSGRHNGDDRAAGFTYDMGGYALRTDYIRLPSKQDSAVWLDTYRFGVMPYINDEVRFFAGVDSYRNAILAIDTNGENLHRFGVAVGDGYAVKYEFRVRL
ncbi:MAG: hypothetical protein ACR2P4_03595 [Gammaproteobacteria bacterium]